MNDVVVGESAAHNLDSKAATAVQPLAGAAFTPAACQGLVTVNPRYNDSRYNDFRIITMRYAGTVGFIWQNNDKSYTDIVRIWPLIWQTKLCQAGLLSLAITIIAL